MDISKINNIGKIIKPESAQKAAPKPDVKAANQDTVTISREAVKAQELSQAKNIVSKSNDIRSERVKEVKAKMAAGVYDEIDNELLEKVADKIVDSLMRR